MKILKEGHNRKLPKKIFTCEVCKCVYEADGDEYHINIKQMYSPNHIFSRLIVGFESKCPCCGSYSFLQHRENED